MPDQEKVTLLRETRVGVAVGCSYRSVRIFEKPARRGAQAVCTCGWKGPRRKHAEKAREDMEAHELDLIPAATTPGIVRTGDHVRIFEDINGDSELGSFRTGRFVGYGPDASDSTPLLFVQIGAGLHAFPTATTRLETNDA